MSLDRDQLRACEAAAQTAGWNLLREAFAERTAGAVKEVLAEATPPQRREVIAAEERGRREVLGWFERQLEDARRLRKVE